MTTGIVSFSYSDWALRYPELASSVGSDLAQLYFNEATLYLNNSAGSVVRDLTRRALLLNMATAHIAALNASLNGQPSSPLVGRINSANEGSVSVQVEMQFPPGSPQWFNQTKYGAAFWQATAPYRSARYIPGHQPNFNKTPEWL